MCGAGLETSGDDDPVIDAGIEVTGVGKKLIDVADGNPELRVENQVEPAEVGRGDTDYGVGTAGECDGFSGDVGVGVEAGFPDAIAENDDGRILFVGAEAAAESERELGDVEEIGGGGLAPEALRIAVAGDGGGEKFDEGGDAGEGVGVVADVREERPGERVAAFVALGGVEGEERGGIADGSGVQDEAADHGEDGGVGADAESESENGDQGEGRFAEEQAGGVAEIAEEGFGDGEGVLLVDSLFCLCEAA